MPDRVVCVGVLTPHAAIGPEDELPRMAPGRVLTHVARIADPPPTSARALRILMRSAALVEAARVLTAEPIDAIAFASTSAAYAIDFEDERAAFARTRSAASSASNFSKRASSSFRRHFMTCNDWRLDLCAS